uniref:Uncharacterized protein n=1 Tax=Anguilla anguilla TaxID=7936 RepID=A0A0E9RKT8_ANGAN
MAQDGRLAGLQLLSVFLSVCLTNPVQHKAWKQIMPIFCVLLFSG